MKLKAVSGIMLTLLLINMVGMLNTNSAAAVSNPTGVPNPDTLIYETYGEPAYLDPAVCYETAGGDIIQNVYETLLFYVGESAIEIEPKLATDWNVSADGLKYTFTLREDVKFHDGTPFNASAMKWSLDRAVLINDPDSGAWILQQCIKGGSDYAWHESWTTGNRTQQYEAALEYLEAEGVKVIDENTLEINIDYMDSGVPTPYPGFKYCAIFSAASAVSPSFVWEHGGSMANGYGRDVPSYFGLEANLSFGLGVVPGEHNEFMDENTCGTGPFKVVEWTHGTRIVLERNEDYWGTLPKLKRVIRNLVEDYATRQLNLLAGEADIITVDVVHATDFYDIATHEVTEPKVKVIAEIPTLNTINFEMNIVKNVTATAPAGKVVTPFGNLKFRKAFQMSFDFDTFIDVALGGHAIRQRNVVPKGMLGYDETVPVYSLDLTTAKTLFEDAMAEMGITKITIELFYNVGNEVRKTGCLMLKDNIEGLDVGVSVKVTELDWPTYLKKLRAQELPIFFIGWLPDYPDPDNYIATYCHSKLGFYAKRIGYENLTINDLVEEAATEINETRRLELYHEIQMEMYRKAFYIFAYQPTTFRVMRTWVQGYIVNPMFSQHAYWLMWKEMRARTFDVVVDDMHYPVSILSNSTVSNFNFNKTEMQISFNVTGDTGTTGYCNVTIPKRLLTGTPWTIKVDDTTITDFDEKTNGTHTFLYFTYTHESPLHVTIEGTWVVPEFPSAMILPLFMILSLIAVVFVKHKKKKQ